MTFQGFSRFSGLYSLTVTLGLSASSRKCPLAPRCMAQPSPSSKMLTCMPRSAAAASAAITSVPLWSSQNSKVDRMIRSWAFSISRSRHSSASSLSSITRTRSGLPFFTLSCALFETSVLRKSGGKIAHTRTNIRNSANIRRNTRNTFMFFLPSLFKTSPEYMIA